MEQQDFRSDIIRKTTGKIRTFLDELANETSNYKSLHNLTEQVEHQYHGRFLIELIQNAHDALNEECLDGDEARLEIVISTEEEPYGALYVANDGIPFTRSNFECLAQLGQSDKDPEKSIGNKGIGFRSVLEVTNAPEIYSRRNHGSDGFGGYCFYFSPEITRRFEGPILNLLNGNDRPLSPLDDNTPLVEWSPEKLNTFRKLYSNKDRRWLAEELKYLSPYLLPIPDPPGLDNSKIRRFQAEGFASVIRIPFKSASAKDLAVTMLEQLDENTILFLERVKFLSLDSGRKHRLVERKVPNLNDPHGGQEITLEVIEDGTEAYGKKRYWSWTEQIGGDEKPEEREQIVTAVTGLPGRWPELTKAKISLAVRVGNDPEDGRINIYLPTELPTGCSAHFSGPFYGDMSRTNVDFSKPFNQLLLRRIGRKAIDVVFNSLVGKELDEAGAILDILAPSPKEERAGAAWIGVINSICENLELNLSEKPLLLSEKGWNTFKYTSLLPEIVNPQILTADMLREHASFPVIVEGLMSRREMIESLFKAVNIDSYPLKDDLAETLEQIANTLNGKGDSADWNGFWSDTIKLFDKDAEPLIGKRVLLGKDNVLHASREECSVFFTPRQGVDDDEVLGEGAIEDIPASLREFVSFLSDRIQIYDEKDARQQTPVRKFLDSTLVQRFRVEDIIRTVLVPRVPPLPAKLNSRNGQLCRDILLWGLRLVAGMPDRGQGRKSTLRWLRELPVPCDGGWYTLKDALFGPGWINSVGTDVFTYLKGAGSEACKDAMKRLLLTPTHKLWEDKRAAYQDLLEFAGVFNGLKIEIIEPVRWPSRAVVLKDSYDLPADPPPGIPSSLWNDYKKAKTPEIRRGLRYSGFFNYEVQPIAGIPGLEKYYEFDLDTRIAFMNVLFASIHKWGESWKEIQVKKIDGMPDGVTIESPLTFCLKNLPWIAIEKDGQREWASPNRQWYVPKDHLTGRAWQFAHLRPLPGILADRIDRNPDLAKVLRYLGMPKFDPEERTASTRLLDTLAMVHEADIRDPNTFINHVRSAWNIFYPGDHDPFPAQVIISKGSKVHQAVAPTDEFPVYLPNISATFVSALGMFSLPVIEIETSVAKRLAPHFKNAYGEAVRLASELEVWPVVDGKRWEIKPGDLLIESDYGWLPSIVLTLFAFSGPQPRGHYTKAFAEAARALRETKICSVSSLNAGLWKGDEIIATPSVPSLWLPEYKILVCAEKSLRHVSELSETFESIVGRDDLEIPLKLVLGKLETLDAPTSEDICAALESLKIKALQYDAALEQWRGDISQMIRMTMPVIALLDYHANIGAMTDINTEDELSAYIQRREIKVLSSKKILDLVRNSDDYYMLGKRLYELLGGTAELDKWNRVLKRIGEKQIVNREAEEGYRNHLKEVHVPLQALLAHILLRSSEAGAFKDLSMELVTIPFPQELAEQFWEIDFNHAIQHTVSLFKRWHALPQEISAVEESTSPEDLRSRLLAVGVDPQADPFIINKQNRDICRDLLLRFQQVAIAWCLRRGLSPLSWEKTAEDLLVNFQNYFDHGAYLAQSNEKNCFLLLKSLPREAAHVEFWNAVDHASDLPSFIKSLSLSSEDLEGAGKALEDYKEKKRRQNRLVSICGKDFDSSEENIGNLWNLFNDEIDVDTLPETKIENIAKLADMPTKKKKGGKKETKEGTDKRGGRRSKVLENLIGFAGEIHAYRMLSKTYGNLVVHPATWKSSNSVHVFPNNTADDSFGCDFVISHMKKNYHIEVKASSGDDETFELGSSEIRHAMDLTRKRNEIFLILHVNDVFSHTPRFRVLPNPYDPRYQKLYFIEDAGARVRYKPKG